MNPDDARPEKYFAGYVECISQDDFGKHVVVGNAQIYSVRTDTSPSEELKKPPFLEARLDKSLWNVFGVNDFVIGCFPENTQAFVFRKPVFGDLPGRIIVPVQVLPWDSFEESSGTPSAAEYLEQRPTGTLTFKYDSLMGKANHPGIVILLDVESRLLFKGFEAIGNRKVRFDNVMRYDGNHAGDGIQNAQTTAESEFVRLANAFADSFSEIKVVAGKFENSEFGLWIPNQYNSYAKMGKHPVLDKEGWVAVSPGGEETSCGDKMDSPAAGSGEENPGGRLRVCDLAKELITTSKELLGLLHDRGYSVHSPQEMLTPELEQYLRKEVQRLYNGGIAADNPASPTEEAEPGAEAAAPATPTEQVAPAEGEETPRGNKTDAPTEGNMEETQEVSRMENVSTASDSREANGTVSMAVADHDMSEGGNRTPSNPRESEIAFLERFVGYTKECGFHYSERDLVRFHTSVKCGMCTLLAGEPGMGKSSLVELYFRALGGEEQNQEKDESFLRVDVNPSWMEPADLLGYRDAGEHFYPATNGLCEFLRSAAKKNEMLFPICLEEINLACVEHYFSDFIQILSRGHGSIKYAGEENGDLTVGENIRFVGTCNSDETTHSMSLRFLDRCHLIELGEEKDDENLSNAKARIKDAFQKGAVMAKPQSVKGWNAITLKEFKAWQETGDEVEIPKTSIDPFTALYDNFIEAEIHVSPRVLWEIVRYVRQRPHVGKFKDGKFESPSSTEEWLNGALDEGIAQRVLPLYRATPAAHKGLQKLKNALQAFELSADIAERRCNEFEKTLDY